MSNMYTTDFFTATSSVIVSYIVMPFDQSDLILNITGNCQLHAELIWNIWQG